MDLSVLTPSQFVSCWRPQDIDGFTSIRSSFELAFLPHSKSPCGTAVRIELPTIAVALVDRSPISIEGRLVGAEGFLSTHLDANRPETISGIEINAPYAFWGAMGSRYYSRECATMRVGTVSFYSMPHNRGWPGFSDVTRVALCSQSMHERLVAAFKCLVELMPGLGDDITFEVAETLEDRVLGEIDAFFLGLIESRAPLHLQSHYASICSRAEDLLRCTPMGNLRIGEVADKLDVSVRTLHTASRAVHGMSFQKYVRLKRLWSARADLLRSPRGVQVKAIALQNGFFHLGRFAVDYHALFGETPSETLNHRRMGSVAASRFG